MDFQELIYPGKIARYSFVWNNDDKSEAMVFDNKKNELLLIAMWEGDKSAQIITQLREKFPQADTLPCGQRYVITKKGLVSEDGDELS